jgi:hypothetical protein
MWDKNINHLKLLFVVIQYFRYLMTAKKYKCCIWLFLLFYGILADFDPLCRLSAISFVIYFFENVGCGKI